MSLDWNPKLYLRFGDERTRAALDLLARVPAEAPQRVVDLGCGPANSTMLLAARWPGAAIDGVDSSAAMVAQACTALPSARFEQGDIASWTPKAPYDVVYSNATLQWLPDHATLIPRLFEAVAPGGWFAVQMPNNKASPSQSVFRDLAASPRWSGKLKDAAISPPIGSVGFYDDLMRPAARFVELWETEYQHRMQDAAAIVEFVRSTAIKPYLDLLSPDELRDFLDEGTALLADRFERRSDGTILFPFRRLFLVAQR
ncbi:MAG: Trans-aconitate 2-methyltransferase [Rhodospirillales bacterium]|nr:Trans-aconitate 2-methyltransferase [Rhodospirillales bacterium]